MTTRRSCRWLLFATALSLAACSAKAEYIGTTKIERSSENEDIIKRLEEYRLAVEQKDAGKLLSMASKE